MTISGFVAYVKQMWKNKPDRSTPVTAERLLHMEEGIKGNSDAVEKIAAAVISQIINDPEKIASMAALFAVNEKVTKLNSELGNKLHYLSNNDATNMSASVDQSGNAIIKATNGSKQTLLKFWTDQRVTVEKYDGTKWSSSGDLFGK